MLIKVGFSPAFLQTRFFKMRAVLMGQNGLISKSNVVFQQNNHPLEANNKIQKSSITKFKGFKTISNAVLSIMMVVSILVVLGVFGPKLYYALFDSQTVKVEAQEEGSVFGEFEVNAENEQEDVVVAPTAYLPPKNDSLPEGDWIIIPRIGVRSQLQATPEAEEALETGFWLVPNYGKAGSQDLPMIVAGHRYGWKWWWKDDYWKYHSFYLLPDLQLGDIVEIISDQRKWFYEIYAGEEGEEISDYSADLILYTCKFLNSPVRHFRYARLINPDVNSQK